MKNLNYIALVLLAFTGGTYISCGSMYHSSIPQANKTLSNKQIAELSKIESIGVFKGEITEDGKEETYNITMNERKIEKTPDLSSILVPLQNGNIVVKQCVNQEGDVDYVELIPQLTTINDVQLIKKAMECAMGYKYEKDYNAPEQQCAVFTFRLDTGRM